MVEVASDCGRNATVLLSCESALFAASKRIERLSNLSILKLSKSIDADHANKSWHLALVERK